MKIRFIIAVLFMTACSLSVEAQCAMCKATSQESNYAHKLNAGILYLLFAPVIVLGGVLVYWMKNKEKFSGNADNKNA